MRHFLRLTLKPQKVEATVTCENHEDCEAVVLIRQDEKEWGDCSAYPNFFEWYEGADTPARSGYINLELSENFVKWSYVTEEKPLAVDVIQNADRHSLFYEPIFRENHGLVHNLKKTSHSASGQELEAVEESLDGLLPTYAGALTDYRVGFITLVTVGGSYYEEKELGWTYA